MSTVLFKRKTEAEIATLPIEDGSLIFNTTDNKILMDYGNQRIQYGGDTTIDQIPSSTPQSAFSVLSNKAITDLFLQNSEVVNTVSEAVVVTATDVPVGCGAIKELNTTIANFIYDGVSHNSIYRGKFLGTSVTATQYANISSGTFTDLFIGDYWTIGGVNYRIAAFDYYWNCGDTGIPPHHAVIVPEKNLYNAVMNPTNTTDGGYVGSQMHTTNLSQAKNIISSAFSGHVVKHRIYAVNAVANGISSGGAWIDSEVDLMNEQMVYGSGIFSPVSTGTAIPTNYRVEKSQLPLFAMNLAMLNTRGSYWLRDVISASLFALVNGTGFADYLGASASLGVRPAFTIS